MVTLPPSVRLFVATTPVDGRKGFDALSLYVQSQLQLDALSGHLFVFFNRRKDVASVLFWDRTGFVLWRKRLERGCFHLPEKLRSALQHVVIEAAELSLMLEGIDLRGARQRTRFRLPPPIAPAATKKS